MKEAMQDVVRAKLESVRLELEGRAMGPSGHEVMGWVVGMAWAATLAHTM